MAAALHFMLLLFLHYGSFILNSAEPDHDTTTVGSDVVFTTTKSLFSAGKTNSTEVPTTRFTTSYRESTTEPPKPTTSMKHLTEETQERRASRKDTEEEEDEGPLELGEWIIIIYVGI